MIGLVVKQKNNLIIIQKMSYNSLTYFNLDLKTLTPRDKFIMRAFVDEQYLTNLYQATDYAKQLWSQGQTYCYKYICSIVPVLPYAA